MPDSVLTTRLVEAALTFNTIGRSGPVAYVPTAPTPLSENGMFTINSNGWPTRICVPIMYRGRLALTKHKALLCIC